MVFRYVVSRIRTEEQFKIRTIKGSQKTQVEIWGAKSGMYLFKISVGEKSTTNKLIIE